MKTSYKIKTYPSGLRLVVQKMPGFKSVSMGVNIHTGSCNEAKGQEGISHFVEHMLFKGTKTRSHEELMKMLDRLGIESNAFTSETDTQFLCTTINDNIETCFDVLSDMYFNLQFSEEDLEKERGVILQEIAMYEDNPMDVVNNVLNQGFYAGTCFSHPVIGNVATVGKFSKIDIENYIKQNYIAKKTIISVAGDISLSQAEKLVLKYFEKTFTEKNLPDFAKITNSKIIPKKQFVNKFKEIEQHSVIVSFPFVNFFDNKRFSGKLFQIVFGNSFTSRLYTEVREKQGLVYGITCYTNLNKIGGDFQIIFGCTPKNTAQVLKTIKTEIDKVVNNGITEEEIKTAKNMIKTSLLRSEESVSGTRLNNAIALANKNEILPAKLSLEIYNKLTVNNVNSVIKEIFDYNHVVVALVGPKTNIKPLDILK